MQRQPALVWSGDSSEALTGRLLGGMNLEIRLYDGRSHRVTVPGDVAAERITAELVELLAMPMRWPDGRPMFWRLHHQRYGDVEGCQTLQERGVADGDTLTLVFEWGC